MEDDKKAKILLHDNSFKDYISRELGKNNIQDFMIEEYFVEQLTKQSTEFEPALIESNWVDQYADFIADGYSREDIEYADESELEEDLSRDIVTDIAQYYIEKYFEDDIDFLEDMIKYVKQCL